MKETNSRGKRKRIKRRIQKLTGGIPAVSNGTSKTQEKKETSNNSAKKQKTQEAEEPEEVEELTEEKQSGNIQLSKETQKLFKKQRKTNDQIIEDDIKAEVKKNKRKKKQKRKEDEAEDEVMKSFEDRINKRLKKIEEAGDDKSIKKDTGFNDVEVDED